MKVRIKTTCEVGDPATGGATIKLLRPGIHDLPRDLAEGLLERGVASKPRAKAKKPPEDKMVAPPENK